MDVHKILARLEKVANELGVDDDSYFWEWRDAERVVAEYAGFSKIGGVLRTVRLYRPIESVEDAMEFEALARKEFGK